MCDFIPPNGNRIHSPCNCKNCGKVDYLFTCHECENNFCDACTIQTPNSNNTNSNTYCLSCAKEFEEDKPEQPCKYPECPGDSVQEREHTSMQSALYRCDTCGAIQTFP